MASATSTAATTPTPAVLETWLHKLWQDLLPAPGRLGKSLRIVLATAIALVLLLVLQMPFIAFGLYFIFLVGRDSPAVSFRSSAFSLLTVSVTVLISVLVVIVTDNDPMARILSVAIMTYLGATLVIASNLPALGPPFGLIYCTVIALWENHAPADRLVKQSLLLIGTFSVSLACAVAVEYVFGERDPVRELEDQRHTRYKVLERMFTLFSQKADPAQRFEAASAVSRLAIAGQSGMMDSYNTIVERNLDTKNLPMGSRVRITMLAQLMDVSAAFGMQNEVYDDPEFLRRCRLIASQCAELDPVHIPNAETHLTYSPSTHYGLLDRVEGVIHALLSMPTDQGLERNKGLVAIPNRKLPIFIPGAIRTREAVVFSLKISFCATLCYIIYHAVAWPGISTSVITVMVTGLSSTAAFKQKMLLRIAGAIVGGILSLGATVFLFPHMDSITSLLVLVCFIAFIAAWGSAGPKFNYFGLQIALTFYFVSFVDASSAPTELAPARDRLIGVLLALVIMWIVFDQISPVRTVTLMRRALAGIIRIGGELFKDTAEMKDFPALQKQADLLRDRMGKTVAGLRTMNDTVEYEFGSGREQHILSGERMLKAALTAAALFWNQFTLLHNELEVDFLTEPDLIAMRHKISDHMSLMAQSIIDKTPFPYFSKEDLATTVMLESKRYGEYTRYTVARYEELETTIQSLASMA